MDEDAAESHRPGSLLDPSDPDFLTSFADVCEELAHQWGQWPEEVMRQPWVRLKRWIEVVLKRRRREWKLQVALAGLGLRGQQAALLGGGGEEPEAMPLSDTERVAALRAAGFTVKQPHVS